MKNKHLIAAIEFAKRLGCIVTRQHADGQTLVTVTHKSGTQSAGRVYKTGSSNPQAVFIKKSAKSFRMVERGIMFRMTSGNVFFCAESTRVLYRWSHERKEWRVWASYYDLNLDYVSTVFDSWCRASVEWHNLKSGVKYYD